MMDATALLLMGVKADRSAVEVDQFWKLGLELCLQVREILYYREEQSTLCKKETVNTGKG